MIGYFIAIVFDTRNKFTYKRKGLITGLVCAWLRAAVGKMNRKNMERFLGRLEWAYAHKWVLLLSCPVLTNGRCLEVKRCQELS